MRLVDVLFMMFLAMFGSVAALAAQTTILPVRSGEHAMFTRLVVQLPSENSWRVEALAKRATLFVDGPELKFDISQTFARIPRTRLRELVAHENRLEMYLACDCEIRAAEDIPQYLVIDVYGAAATAESSSVASMRPIPRPEDFVSRWGTKEPMSKRAGDILARYLRGYPSTTAPKPSFTLDMITPDLLDSQNTSSDMSSSRNLASSVSELGSVLGQKIASSVAQGVLKPAGRDQGSVSIPIKSASENMRLEEHLFLPQSTGHWDGFEDNLVTLDRCDDLSLLDLSKDGVGAEAKGMRFSLVHLYNALDQLNRKAVIEHARSLLAIGFGAEAALHASLLDPSDSMVPLIFAMGRIADHGPVPSAVFSGIQSCGSQGAFWTFLGTSPESLTADFPYNQVARAFDAMPPALREGFAPHLVQRLIAVGQSDVAHRIRASLVRLSDQHSVASQMVNVALTHPDFGAHLERSRQELRIQDISDDLLLMLLVQDEMGAHPTDPELLLYAQDRQTALRGDPLGQELAIAVVSALMRAGKTAEAFALVEGPDAALPQHDVVRLTRDLLETVTESGEDMDFVTAIFDQQPWNRSDLDANLSMSIAARLSQLGFSEHADLIGNALVHRDRRVESLSTALRDSANVLKDMQAGETDTLERQRFSAGATDDPFMIPQSDSDGADALSQSNPETGRSETTALVTPSAEQDTTLQRDETVSPEFSLVGEIAGNADAQGVLAQTRSLLRSSVDLRAELQGLLADEDESTIER